MLTRLLGQTSHDIGNLNITVHGFSDLALAEADPKGPAADEMQQIVRAAEGIQGLLRQLLRFARMSESAGGCDLAQIVTDELARAESTTPGLRPRIVHTPVSVALSPDRASEARPDTHFGRGVR